MLVVHFIKMAAGTLGSLVQGFHESVSHAGQVF